MFRIFILLILFISPYQIKANNHQDQNDLNSQTTYGGIGLIQTPTARFSDDGEFGFGISTEEPFNRLYAKMQFFPWMEAVLRYTEGTHHPYGEGGAQTWKDKGIDFKFRLLKESTFLPELALGLSDFGGTAAFSSEYIVASKKIDNIDFSIGLGWGKLAGSEHINNPLSWLDDNKKSRVSHTTRGGKIDTNRFFAGKSASFFGGIEYFTPINNLSLKIEYDSSDYSELENKEIKFDEIGDIFKLDSRINYAINYRLNIAERDNIDFSIGFLRGNTLYANVAVHSNLNFSGTPNIIMGAEKLRESNLEPFSKLNNEWQEYLSDTIIWELGNAGFVTHNVIFNGTELVAEISQGRFLKTTQALDLASRILANNAPKNIKTLTIINVDQGIETLRSSVEKEVLVYEVQKGGASDNLFKFNKRLPFAANRIVKENDYLYPNFYWEIKPHMLGTIQHQEKFYFWQLEALIHTEYSIKKGLYFTTDIGINIDNNYEDYYYHIPDGELYHVRQDRRLYLTEGESGLRRMALDYLIDFHPNIKAKLSAGYIEWMYGGIGGEVLYIPNHKKWALGIDAYFVKQRDFDQKFSFQDYETVTGFLTYYRDIPFYDMRMKLSMGKFLAEDIGAQIDLSRRFDSGARVGGIVALTDCDAVCVGEGSFNKWIYFELPMDLFYTQSSTRHKTGYAWSPLTKDAGQKLENGNLYNVMLSSTDEVDTLRQKSWSLKKIFSGFSTRPKEKI